MFTNSYRFCIQTLHKYAL